MLSAAFKPVRFARMVRPMSTGSSIVVLDYNDLIVNKVNIKDIEAAYGFDGLGILAVKNVPRMQELRQRILPLATRFAHLPKDIQAKYEHPESFYSFGWSHGKEKMSEGRPDLSKGSYYNNPVYDLPFNDPNLIKKYPSFCSPNIWPKKDLPEFEGAFKDMAYLVVHVGTMVARATDKYVEEITGKNV